MSWCSDAPEDEAISLFAGLLANPDVRLSLQFRKKPMGALSAGLFILYLPNVVCDQWRERMDYRSVCHNVPPALNFSSLLGNCPASDELLLSLRNPISLVVIHA